MLDIPSRGVSTARGQTQGQSLFVPNRPYSPRLAHKPSSTIGSKVYRTNDRTVTSLAGFDTLSRPRSKPLKDGDAVGTDPRSVPEGARSKGTDLRSVPDNRPNYLPRATRGNAKPNITSSQAQSLLSPLQPLNSKDGYHPDSKNFQRYPANTSYLNTTDH